MTILTRVRFTAWGAALFVAGVAVFSWGVCMKAWTSPSVAKYRMKCGALLALGGLILMVFGVFYRKETDKPKGK